MENTDLIKKLGDYGADVAGIVDRFMGDEKLYQKCLVSFMQDGNFEQLRQAIEDDDIPSAFEAAHALKGVTGNMGVTPMYRKVCDIVEKLRIGQLEGVAADYEDLMSHKEALCVQLGLDVSP